MREVDKTSAYQAFLKREEHTVIRKELSPELAEKVEECKSASDVLALAKRVGLPLSEEELDEIAGGEWDERLSSKPYHRPCLTPMNCSEPFGPVRCPRCDITVDWDSPDIAWVKQ